MFYFHSEDSTKEEKGATSGMLDKLLWVQLWLELCIFNVGKNIYTYGGWLGINDNDEVDHGVHPEDPNVMGYQKN